jgi:UDP-N-acetylglucosamine 4,6-dehydratase/5-epimerase
MGGRVSDEVELRSILRHMMEKKRILIFGGSGSLGRALLNRWSAWHDLGVYSRDEAKHWTLKNQLPFVRKLDFFVGDVRDRRRIKEVLREFQPQIVIIAAALKQVDTCENTPSESLKTNVVGVSNVLENCVDLGKTLSTLECVLMVSTDKACSPTNVYGMSKAIAERIVVSKRNSMEGVRFVGVRYGNVLDSRGSIVPLFRYQAQSGGNFTITDSRMTRFLMTLDESIDLIEDTITNGESGDFWIPRLRSMKILDLAQIFSEKFGREITEIGIRPGEKLHEDLISPTESLRATTHRERIILKPATDPRQLTSPIWTYSSENDNISKDELAEFLLKKEVFSIPLEGFVGKDIEEIRTSDTHLRIQK